MAAGRPEAPSGASSLLHRWSMSHARCQWILSGPGPHKVSSMEVLPSAISLAVRISSLLSAVEMETSWPPILAATFSAAPWQCAAVKSAALLLSSPHLTSLPGPTSQPILIIFALPRHSPQLPAASLSEALGVAHRAVCLSRSIC